MKQENDSRFFIREFGRTLTFLYRSRAKFMGERLRDFDDVEAFCAKYDPGAPEK